MNDAAQVCVNQMQKHARELWNKHHPSRSDFCVCMRISSCLPDTPRAGRPAVLVPREMVTTPMFQCCCYTAEVAALAVFMCLYHFPWPQQLECQHRVSPF
jgi:hypothetical protein